MIVLPNLHETFVIAADLTIQNTVVNRHVTYNMKNIRLNRDNVTSLKLEMHCY